MGLHIMKNIFGQIKLPFQGVVDGNALIIPKALPLG